MTKLEDLKKQFESECYILNLNGFEPAEQNGEFAIKMDGEILCVDSAMEFAEFTIEDESEMLSSLEAIQNMQAYYNNW